MIKVISHYLPFSVTKVSQFLFIVSPVSNRDRKKKFFEMKGLD